MSKSESEGRTLTIVRALQEAERVEELARMLGGQKITERTRSLAEEMLSLRKAKKSGKAERRV